MNWRRIFGVETRSGHEITIARTTHEINEMLNGSRGRGPADFVVTPKTAMESPTFLACTRLLSETTASLPLLVYRRVGDGKERDRSHSLYRVLHDIANPWTSAYELRLALTIDALTSRSGSGFARVIRVGGRVIELHRLAPDSVSVRILADGSPSYSYTENDGKVVTLSYRDVLHLRPFSMAPDVCISLSKELSDPIRLEVTILRHLANMMANGAKPSMIVSPKTKSLNPVSLKNVRDAIVEQVREGQTILMIPEPVEVEITQFSSVDAQTSDLIRHTVETISRGFKVPPPLINQLDRATHNNSEAMGRQFSSYSLRPIIAAWESAIRRTLIAPGEMDTVFVEHLLDDLVSADIRAKYEAFAKAVGGPWLTANEVRSIDNRLPMAGGESLRAPLNTAPAEDPPPRDDDGREDDDREAA